MLKTLRAKLILAFSVMLALMLLMLMLGINANQNSQVHLQRLLVDRVELLEDLSAVEDLLMENGNEMVNFLLQRSVFAGSTMDDRDLATLAAHFSERRLKIDAHLARYQKTYMTPEEAQLFKQFESQRAAWLQAITPVLQQMTLGEYSRDQISQMAAFLRIKSLWFTPVHDTLNALITLQAKAAQAETAQAQAEAQQANATFIAVVLLALLLSVVAIGWLMHILARRTQQLSARAGRILSTEFAEEEEEEEEAHDELAEVDQALRLARQNARSILLMARRTRALAERAEYMLSTEFAEEEEEEEEEEEAQDALAGVALALRTARQYARDIRAQHWVQTGLSGLSSQMRGDLASDVIAQQVVGYLARYIDAQVGALFVWNETAGALELAGGYAFEHRRRLANRFALGEGLIGQAAREKRLISVTHLPDDFVRIQFGEGAAIPRHCVVVPLLYEGRVKGVIELARVRAFDPLAIDMLKQAAEALGIAFHAAAAGEHTRELLRQTQGQALQLQLQQEYLTEANEALSFRTEEIALKNAEMELVQADLYQQTEDLALASQYKSEFLANMSHELRTPLNAMLILSKILADNRDGNLNARQIESAQVVHQSGQDLLAIINDILDLSKIEAGKEQALSEEIVLSELMQGMQSLYHPAALEKHLDFTLSMDAALPSAIVSDRKLLGQILRNLISNAMKFTREGGITLKVALLMADTHFHSEGLKAAIASGKPVLSFAVMDTGIGIPIEKQRHIWEAFQQADGSTSREFGGTGLGLTISRELAKLLGGEIHLHSEPGQGSTFTLFIPLQATDAQPLAEPLAAPFVSTTPVRAPLFMPTATEVAVDFAGKTVLLVDDDIRNLFSLSSWLENHGLKVLTALNGQEALDVMAEPLDAPIDLLLIDMMMPVMDGYALMRTLRAHERHARLPILALTAKAMPEDRELCMDAGATDYLVKPIDVDRLVALLRQHLYR